MTQRNRNVSAFSGYRTSPSDYSEVVCVATGLKWRSKGSYVDSLPNASYAPDGSGGPLANQTIVELRKSPVR